MRVLHDFTNSFLVIKVNKKRNCWLQVVKMDGDERHQRVLLGNNNGNDEKGVAKPVAMVVDPING